MSKFNVGDKITRVADEYPQYGMYIGKVYTVKEVEDGFEESISVEEIPNKFWMVEYFELHYELNEQPAQEYQDSIIEELEAKIDNLEELVSDQAHQINQLTEALDNFARLTHYFSTEGVGKLPNAKLGDSVVDAILDYFKGDFEKQFKPVREYTLEDWEQAIANDWVFETRCGEKVTIDLIDGEECNRPILCSAGWYHNINGMWDDTTGEDADDIIRRVS